MDDAGSCAGGGCPLPWRKLIDHLHELQKFCVHTGNVNNYMELKLKRFANSAEELSACLDLQFTNFPEDGGRQAYEEGFVTLADKEHQSMPTYERDDLKITLKIFLEDFNFAHIQEAIGATLSQLDVNLIELLIVAFPESDEPEPRDEEESTQEVNAGWFASVLQVWGEIEEKLVSTGQVMSIGVADFHLAPLRKLYEAAKVKPCVDHFSIDGCCMVPTELQEYARDHDIQLLTHSDPHPFPLKQIFRTFCSKQQTDASPEKSACCAKFEPLWAARYTLWVRRRSLMAAKGYIVQFSRSK